MFLIDWITTSSHQPYCPASRFRRDASQRCRSDVLATTQRAIVISGQRLGCAKSPRHILNACKNHVRADRSKETRAGEELPRLPVKIGNPEAEIAARKLFDEFGEDGLGCAVDRRHGFGIWEKV